MKNERNTGYLLTAKEAGKQWGMSASLVAHYCAEGMIPSAEKQKGVWMIPAGVPKPLCTRYMAAKCLSNILQIKESASPDFTLYRKDAAQLADSFQYLSDLGFCTPVKWKADKSGKIDFLRSLKNTAVTSSGMHLIEIERKNSENAELRKKGELSVTGKAGGGILPLNFEVTAKKEL